MAIAIRAIKDGFRRCGMAHSAKEKTYPDDRFTKKELEILKKEPMLIVHELPDPEDDGVIAKTDKPIDDMTVPELKNLCDELKIQYTAKHNKPDLVAMINKHTAEPPKE